MHTHMLYPCMRCGMVPWTRRGAGARELEARRLVARGERRALGRAQERARAVLAERRVELRRRGEHAAQRVAARDDLDDDLATLTGLRDRVRQCSF